MKHITTIKRALACTSLLLLAAIPAMAQPLNGTYTIGGVSPNYLTLDDAAKAISTNGITGPVTFNVRPGVYSGAKAQGILDNVLGTSATNTITFKPENGRGTVRFNPTGTSSDNYVIKIANTNYVTIQDLTLDNAGTSEGVVIALSDGSSNNTITRCLITGDIGTSTGVEKARIYCDGLSGSNNVFSEDSIVTGSYAVYWRGDGTADNNTFSDNRIIDPHAGGIRIINSNNDKILNNVITTDPSTITSGTFYGFYPDFANGIEISGNNLQSIGVPTDAYYPLYLRRSNQAGGNLIKVRNNVFNVSTSGNNINIRVRFSNNYNIAKNVITFSSTVNGASMWAPDVDNNPSGTYGNNTSVDSNIISLINTDYGNMNIISSNQGHYHSFSGNTVTVNTQGNLRFYGKGSMVTNAVVSNNTMNVFANDGASMFVGGDWNGGDTLLIEKNTIDVLVGPDRWCDFNVYQQAKECKILNNIFKVKTGGNGGANINMSSTAGGPNTRTNNVIAGNKFTIDLGTCTNWANGSINSNGGCYDKIYNNVFIAKAAGSTNAQTTAFSINSYNTEVYNNTMANLSTTTNPQSFAYQVNTPNSGVPFETKSYNNIIYLNGGGGRPLSVGEPTMGQTLKFDYNNIYSTNTNFIWNSWNWNPGPADIVAWRTASGQDMNSLSYEPAFTNIAADDFTPDPSNPNCWSMNGRGVHIAGNNADIDGSPRAISTGVGVPDLGAYEFVPDAGVLPPLCVVTPAGAPVAGATQTFTFGGSTVASITWDAAATVPAATPDCRQYTGTVPPGLTAFNPTYMYFYTDINSSTGADYEAKIYYKEPWLGTIGSEAVLNLAKKDGANPWTSYPIGTSGVNTTDNFIFSPSVTKLNTYGLYTGVDIANNAGTDVVLSPTGYFCPGTYPVTVRIKNNGNNVLNSVKINWEINGVAGAGSPITYTTPIPVHSGPANSNAAIINLGNVAFGAGAKTFRVWTSEPNGVTDIVPADDEITTTLRAALQGNFTIGGTTPDFATVEQAIDDLNKLGICGPVVFNIRPGTYTSTKALTINTIIGSSAANRVTFQSENNSATSVVVDFTSAGWPNVHTLRLDGASNLSLKNITLSASSPTECLALKLEGNVTDDSVIGCILTTNPVAIWGSRGIAAELWSSTNTGNLIFQNNTINAYNGVNFGGNSNSFTRNVVFEHNTFNRLNQNSFNSIHRLKFNYNTINSTSTDWGSGLDLSNWGNSPADNNFEIIGNKLVLAGGINGININTPHGNLSDPPSVRSTVANNAVFIGTGGNPNNGISLSDCSNADILNNSVNVTNTLSGCNAFAIRAGGYPFVGNVVKNNVFVNTGSGLAAFIDMDSDNSIDYNNFYATGTNLIDGSVGTFTDYPSYRSAASGNNWDQNSISYAPGFTSASDLRPDATNSNSWSLNGRGEQLSNSAVDIDGNARPTILADGVPDIGAYEFEPTSLPPAAVATPAVAAPGVTQRFTFGGQNVATVKWNTAMAITTPLVVRQYSGRIPPANFTTISPNHQYFYTTMTPTAVGVTYDFDLTVNYFDTWMGTMPSEPDMKLAHQLGASPWISYNEANSVTNDADNTITAAGVTSFGSFTGIEDGLNFSALIKRDPNDPPIICTGKSVTLNASPVSGGSTTYNYVWKRNGVAIPGANTSSLVVTLGGDYTVTITGTQTATSLPEVITVTAAPMALIGVSGTLTYCTGGVLTLNSASPVNAITHQWQLNGMDIPGANDTTYNVSTAGTYTLIVTNAGCSDTSVAAVVNAGPIAVNLGADFAACEVKDKRFTLDAGYPGAKYLWSTGETTQTIEVDKSGTYSVQVDAGPSCNGSDAINVTVKPLPSATGISTIRTNNTYTFSPSGAQNVTKLLWIFGDGTTNSANTVIKTFDGNMTVKLVVYNDCGTDTLQMMQWATGITKTENGSINASLYPNPATEKTLLSVDGAKIEDVTILNAVGQVVYRTSLEVKSATIELPVNNLAAGRYIVRATTTEGIISKPLNVQR